MKKEQYEADKRGPAEKTRRAFLKKAAYSAPSLIALGELLKPKTLHADGTGGPEGPPGDWNPW